MMVVSCLFEWVKAELYRGSGEGQSQNPFGHAGGWIPGAAQGRPLFICLAYNYNRDTAPRG
ncbi:MAG TPA: hypothetical protein PLJ99_02940, partial [Kiritimatiellia bacterium]|nr:hypothetical protein [Kiritimatiellia bacterium]